MSVDGTPTKRYVSRDYQLNPSTGEVIVYYRFGGRAVAWKGNGALRYLLADHLSSSQSEVGADQAELAQRRYYPFGGDRPATITGMADLAQDERYTGQWRIEGAGGNNDRKELYHYGARWYLPGVGIFTQPDTIVPDWKNPQALNRFAYVYNNPMLYIDPTGNDPADWDPAWAAEWRSNHPGKDPQEQDWQDYQFSLKYPGTGPGGSWTQNDWLVLTKVRDILGPELLSQIGKRGGMGMSVYSTFGYWLSLFGDPRMKKAQGPDGTRLILSEPPGTPVGPGIYAITFGDQIILPVDEAKNMPLLNHEYTHVLQYRYLEIQFGPEYADGGFYNWAKNPLEQQGVAIQDIYVSNPWLPPIWEFMWVGWGP